MGGIRYCPVCSAYLKNPNLERCPKCHSILRVEMEKKEIYEASLRRKSELVQGPFHPVTGKKCIVCGEDVEVLPVQIEEFTVSGEKVGDGPMGPLRAPNRCVVAFQAWRCRKGHRLFSSYDFEWRELCPNCLTHNNRYGNLVRSCSQCRTMVPIDYYKKEDPLELMKKRGYHFDPDLEKR
ncbi:MAG: hypothetical protein ACMUIE_01600 [Thermoplasmatota archaeon]